MSLGNIIHGKGGKTCNHSTKGTVYELIQNCINETVIGNPIKEACGVDDDIINHVLSCPCVSELREFYSMRTLRQATIKVLSRSLKNTRVDFELGVRIKESQSVELV
jgi:hypothetical protein